MAHFLPSFNDASFKSEGEHDLFKTLAALDDSFTVIHSCPWLRGCMERIFSKEERRYVELFRHNRKNLSGEIDFVIVHPNFGLLCIEVKTGSYRPQGSRFVHALNKHIIDPLEQVRNNAFTTIEMLKENDIACPVGYAVYFSKSDLKTSDFAQGYFPLGQAPIQDGILILPKHEATIAERVRDICEFWRNALYPGRNKFDVQIQKFVDLVWPSQVLSNELGRKIQFDNEVWLKLDHSQHLVVQRCMRSRSFLTAGFAGSGKTLIAYAIASSYALVGRRVAFLFKNKRIAKHISDLIRQEPFSQLVTVSTFHAYCERYIDSERTETPNFDEYWRFLLNKHSTEFDCLIVDEAQGLNEADHLALNVHFRGARKFVFADRYQLFKNIEKGVDYDFLERTYGAEPYFLNAVYRNPSKITDEILQILPVSREILNQRNDNGAALEQYLVRDVDAKLAHYIERLKSKGAQECDIVVLTQYQVDFPGLDVEVATIASFRGMEAPIVIILPDIGIDDNTLACALGRCTTLAIVLWDSEKFFTHRPLIRSDYVQHKFERSRPALLAADFKAEKPRFLQNVLKKNAGALAWHMLAGCQFVFASRWRGWVVDRVTWPNSEAHLWGIFVEGFTNARVFGVNLDSNQFSFWLKARECAECKIVTPHSTQGACLPCGIGDFDANLINSFNDVVIGVSRKFEQPLQSIYNVIQIISGTNAFYDSEVAVGETGRDLEILLSSILVQYHTKIGDRFSKAQVSHWIESCVAPEHFGFTLKEISGRVISSLCSRKIIEKVATETYVRLDIAA